MKAERCATGFSWSSSLLLFFKVHAAVPFRRGRMSATRVSVTRGARSSARGLLPWQAGALLRRRRCRFPERQQQVRRNAEDQPPEGGGQAEQRHARGGDEKGDQRRLAIRRD